MLIKIFKNKGKGSAKASIDYLLGKERNRELATILKGNPELSLEVAQSLTFANKYTVGCLSFEEDNLPHQSKLELMEKFENMVFAGLHNEQFNISWIEHRDKGRLELNFFIPNVELISGKRYQPYFHKSDKNLFDSWIQLQNAHYKLSDPHDPRKKQLCKFEFSSDMKQSQIKEDLTNLIANGITEQQISSREDIIELLEQSGFKIERTTEKSISISHPALKKNIRLSGAIYEHREFDGKFAEEFKRETALYQSRTGERVKQAQKVFEQLLQRRVKFNQKKYRKIESLVNSPSFDYQHSLLSSTDCTHSDTTLSKQQNRFHSSEITTIRNDVQPTTTQRSFEIKPIRERENYSIKNPTRTRENIPKPKWKLYFRDLQGLGIAHAKRIQRCIKRLLSTTRDRLEQIIDRKRSIQITEFRITQSKRTINTAQQRITESELTIKSAIKQQKLKPAFKIII
ncbi:relaxase/mobilization nuclease domain-containing protein [Otariodibacter oris]|uniref:Relaxase/mobilization nuclease-like protein n=1 Tax=Otariodibacter oris TaxID=1032623 RepID=A0A420XI75_9PAST|nr:relaxase/mobilization nuclease domain-containing protein [Otariodibacter oris]QGM80867.1 mobilization protein [Otariodibacter oris]RKR76959.1 relaxase/mobilization nuclease-like protein [Otariodibacter oris]